MCARAESIRGTFSRFLLEWFRINKRSFPWRETNSPYEIAVSEAMLQKTAAVNVELVYADFLEKYPTVEALAKAELEDLEQLWQPLGLPRRARLLYALAEKVVADYAGEFPNSEGELRKLPGVGPYGAAAIACLTFNERAPMIDINVMRILHRVFSVPFKPRNTPSKKLRQLVLDLMPEGEEVRFNLALVDLGALLCRPQKPQCTLCPLSPICEFHQQMHQTIAAESED